MGSYRDSVRKYVAVNAAFYLFGLVVLFLVLWGLWRAWDTAASPVWKLRKDQWACTDSRMRRATLIDGRYGTPRAVSATDCYQYSRRQP